ncbi:MAG: DmsC/YnfH family molybdoenzyme membrane anchor subunit [Pirellula sp.]
MIAPRLIQTAEPSLLDLLLRQQNDFSAVEEFARWHDSASLMQSTYQALMPAREPKPGEQYAFEVNLDTCSGCKACVVACHALNGLSERETWRKVGTLTSQNTTGLPVLQHVTTACHHCVDPGCLNGCPVGAYEKDAITGTVRHLDDQCFGCKYCTMMCPYEVPQYSESLGIVRKCDMCSQRLSEGEPPACVQACPNQAIRITIVNQQSIATESCESNTVITESRAGLLNRNPVSLVATAPYSRITRPTTRYKTDRSDLLSAQMWPAVSNQDEPHEGHWPLAMMLTLTQASVGMWCVMIFLSLAGVSSFAFRGALSSQMLGMLGVHVALLHLGRPWLAFRSWIGWRTSWLSREAIALGLYLGASSASIASLTFLGNTTYIATAMIALAGVAGVAGVICSSMVYIATQRELWGTVRTGFDFATTTLGLGLLGSSLCVNENAAVLLLLGALFTCLASAFKMLDVFHCLRDHRRESAKPNDAYLVRPSLSSRSGRTVLRYLKSQWISMWALNGFAIATSIATLWLSSNGLLHDAQPWFSFLAIMAFTASMCAQMLNRWLYFASVVFRRMPGAGT